VDQGDQAPSMVITRTGAGGTTWPRTNKKQKAETKMIANVFGNIISLFVFFSGLLGFANEK